MNLSRVHFQSKTMSEGGRRIAIGIDESDFAEQAFNCKYLPFFSSPYVVYHVSIKKVADRNQKKV